MRHNRRAVREAGFTLVEVLVALVILGIIMTQTYRTFFASERSHQIGTEVSFAQQNARAGLQMVTRDLRMAGSGFGGITVETSYDGASLILHPVRRGDLEGNGWEAVTILLGADGTMTSLRDDMPNASAEIKCDDVSGFEEGELCIITDGVTANLFEVTGIQDPPGNIQHNPGQSDFNDPGGHTSFPPGGYGPGSWVIKLSLITYELDRTDGDRPRLTRSENDRDPVAVADYIDRFDFVFTLADGDTTSMPADPNSIRQVGLSVDGLTRPTTPGGQRTVEASTSVRPRCL